MLLIALFILMLFLRISTSSIFNSSHQCIWPTRAVKNHVWINLSLTEVFQRCLFHVLFGLCLLWHPISIWVQPVIHYHFFQHASRRFILSWFQRWSIKFWVKILSSAWIPHNWLNLQTQYSVAWPCFSDTFVKQHSKHY